MKDWDKNPKFRDKSSITQEKRAAADAVRSSKKLITKMVEFFDESIEHMLPNGSYGYKKDSLKDLSQKLYKIK